MDVAANAGPGAGLDGFRGPSRPHETILDRTQNRMLVAVRAAWPTILTELMDAVRIAVRS